MGITLKLTAIGNSTGVILPKEILAKLNMSKGDNLYLTETPEGYMVSPYDDKFAEAVEEAGEFMNEYRDVMKELAK